ncbi:hypothetical protein Moror_7857 [Moniliophthora roreri MCA 2997]|uniref:Uncharacterized protein n=2 Tax=Moniliophthora roreri TaxID=221103 RepID=V2YEF7_MONRO|nr:hypothetical protein Moror_7857 [Moniliophthora roreri MCA 2997]KAI3613739.1 hypothetical protein WG66_013619 [Moniliophthora roreri]
MVTTRRQAATSQNNPGSKKDSNEFKKPPAKRQISEPGSEPPSKKPKSKKKATTESEPNTSLNKTQRAPSTGTIERGHIYFFYRPKVQKEEAHSLDDVKNFHMLLVPRPPEFASSGRSTFGNDSKAKEEENPEADLAVLEPGADAIPSEEPTNTSRKRFRLVTIGKKKLPDPERGGAGKGRKETFWGTVTKVGDNLDELENGLGEKTYETKTRGTRHEEPARLVGRGGYAIVNNDPRVPSERETHMGYHLSHPSSLGDVQTSLGIYEASSFVLQVKNPLAPATFPGQASGKGPEYPSHIMDTVFGKGRKGRESYGLRFASCETVELLDYEGAQLLFIAAREGEEGLETSLGDGRGNALEEHEAKESTEPVDKVFKELALDLDMFPEDAIKGEWI